MIPVGKGHGVLPNVTHTGSEIMTVVFRTSSINFQDIIASLEIQGSFFSLLVMALKLVINKRIFVNGSPIVFSANCKWIV